MGSAISRAASHLSAGWTGRTSLESCGRCEFCIKSSAQSSIIQGAITAPDKPWGSVIRVVLSKTVISIIGRRHPEIFDILGNPVGPLLRNRFDEVALNPQPLPPLRVGILAGQEVVRLAFTATRLHVGFEIDPDDWCPTFPRRPKMPPIPWPPFPWPWDATADVDDGWAEDYAIGLAFALEASAHLWEGLDSADAITELHGLAIRNASSGQG